MAVDVQQQQERSQGFILYPKHDPNHFIQPVPLATLPGAAGQLPAWEQKKLELEMASTDVNDGEEEHAQGHSQVQDSIPTQKKALASTTAPSSQPLPRQSSIRRSGSAFFSSLRSPSSRQASNSGANSRTRTASHNSYNNSSRTNGNANGMLNGNGSTVQVHHDPSGGIGTSPRASSKKRSSSLVMYFKKHFGIENHPEFDPATAPARNSASSTPRSSHAAGSSTGGGANKLKKSPSQRLAATSSSRYGNNSNNGIGYNGNDKNRKTRSSGFADKMRLASGKLSTKAKQTWRRFNSQSKPEEVPQTWAEWRAAYARGEIDVSDLPPPPPKNKNASSDGEDDNPYENQYLAAPMPEDFRRRQLAFNRLDIEGKRGGVRPSEIAVPEGEEPLPDTLESHPAFRDIVSKARETFDSAIAILTVFNENRQLFLAETGLGGMKEVPREVTFCSHAVLQSPPEPFVLNDTHKDWRFANSPLVQQYGCRAYYGVPLLAPDFSGSDDDPVPIGTLCIIDNKPRDQFTVEQRQKMNDLALLAQKTIANWSRARFRARLDAMERSFQIWKNEAVALADGPGSNLGLYTTSRENKYTLPSSHQPKRSIEYSDGGVNGALDRSHYHEAPTKPTNGGLERSPDLYISQVPQAHDKTVQDPHGRTTNGDATPASPTKDDNAMTQKAFNATPVSLSNKQKIYDISTRLVGDSLELTLVYILRLNLSPVRRASIEAANNGAQDDSDASVQSLSLVSSFGLPSPEPAFDAVLHMKALRSEEGGLLYQNPRADELRAGERMPQTEEVEYASALLVPICESETSGYVLAGFTDDPERVFERSDLEYMTTIASELAIYLMD